MKTALKPLANTKRDWQWPLLMAFIRLPLILAGSGLAILAYQLAGRPVGLAAGLAWSTLTLTIVNLLNLGLLVQRSHVEDFDLKKTLGFEWGRLGRDILIGIVFSLVLGGLLLIGVFGIVLLLYGADGFTKMETVFVGEADFSFTLPSWLALVSALAFPLLNPLVEELHYRGYTQPRLISTLRSIPIGILLTSVGFGLQHVVFAVTLASALAYATGFFLWGLGAGLIYHRQGRLAPLVIAHFISNLSFGIVPLIMISQGS